LRIEPCNNESIFDTLGEEWNVLLARSRARLIFLTREWLQTWWEAYHPGELWVLIGRDEDGTLAGIAPWFITTQDGVRTVCTVGCVDVTDYLDVLVAQEHEEAFLAALADYVAASTDQFDQIALCNIPQASPTLAFLPEMLSQQGFEVEVTRQDVCPIITLPATWDDYLADNLNKKQRHELRRKIRRAGDGVDWYVVGPQHDLAAELDRFLDLMAASSPYKAEFLADERNTAFFKQITPRLMDMGYLQLSFLTIGAEPAAAYLNFDYDDTIMVYNSGQDIERFGAFSPGIVLLANLIRDAIERGYKAFDFLRGNETYKYQMGGQDTEIFELKARRE
jgi:CelD/BcsL family acetyltransferase involved in cellulose biosynthesis